MSADTDTDTAREARSRVALIALADELDELPIPNRSPDRTTEQVAASNLERLQELAAMGVVLGNTDAHLVVAYLREIAESLGCADAAQKRYELRVEEILDQQEEPIKAQVKQARLMAALSVPQQAGPRLVVPGQG